MPVRTTASPRWWRRECERDLLSVGKLFHVAHIVEELAPLDAWYDRVFAPVRGIMDGNYAEPIRRMASLLVIGDTIVEAMSPSPGPEAVALPIGRFQARFGRHWHSVAWFTDDVGGVWDRLTAHGLRVINPRGGPDQRPLEGDIYTHPKDTHSQLEFFQPPVTHGGPAAPGHFADPRFEPDWPAPWLASPNPLGIDRLAYVTIVVPDLEQATAVYCDGIGATLLRRAASPLTGTECAYVSVGPETVLELAQPTESDSLAGQELAAHGGMCHAVAFTVADLDQAEAHLGRQGVAVLARDETTILTDPDDCFGAPFRFTTWKAPGDPRD
jgi:catechol 2,3-dioxygenase-like lactoylglutathione lyase family enzyme